MSSYTDTIYQSIYEKILDGTLHPDQKLHIAQLAEMFGVGLSPVREALSKLTATDLVIAASQRGFKVAPLSVEDLNDIYTTRTLIEKTALSLAMERGDENWEAHLIAAYHRLSQIEKKISLNTPEEYKFWEKHHREFNLALIAACGLRHLLAIQEKLYQQTERYRRIWFFAGLDKDKILQFSINQKALMDAALARDTAEATLLLEKHFDNAKSLIAAYLKKSNISE